MELFNRLPDDIRNKMFQYFRHPTAQIIIFHRRPSEIKSLLVDILDYSKSLKKLYTLPCAVPQHDGAFGQATLLNTLWMEAHQNCGNYYNIWKRMYRVRCIKTAKWWIGYCYAVNCHKFQIHTLWALFTPTERRSFINSWLTL